MYNQKFSLNIGWSEVVLLTTVRELRFIIIIIILNLDWMNFIQLPNEHFPSSGGYWHIFI